MSVQTEKLRQMLGSFGWELIEARTIGRRWIAEIWLLRSTWSPTDCEIYLTFDTDPQGRSNDFSRGWFVSSSFSRPFDWFTAIAEEHDNNIAGGRRIAYLSTVKDKDTAELFAELAALRNDFVSSAD